MYLFHLINKCYYNFFSCIFNLCTFDKIYINYTDFVGCIKLTVFEQFRPPDYENDFLLIVKKPDVIQKNEGYFCNQGSNIIQKSVIKTTIKRF
jgi:hypothetical protein